MEGTDKTAREEVYLLRANELLGPYPREQAERFLEDGSIGENELVKIGLDGRPFPAAILSRKPR